jgi:hypothetical protein
MDDKSALPLLLSNDPVGKAVPKTNSLRMDSHRRIHSISLSYTQLNSQGRYHPSTLSPLSHSKPAPDFQTSQPSSFKFMLHLGCSSMHFTTLASCQLPENQTGPSRLANQVPTIHKKKRQFIPIRVRPETPSPYPLPQRGRGSGMHSKCQWSSNVEKRWSYSTNRNYSA